MRAATSRLDLLAKEEKAKRHRARAKETDNQTE
jgi:hypothetical protein